MFLGNSANRNKYAGTRTIESKIEAMEGLITTIY